MEVVVVVVGWMDGWTPMICAASDVHVHVKVVKCLSEKGGKYTR